MAYGQGPFLAQALLYRMEHIPVQTLDVGTLFAESARSPEETCVQVSATFTQERCMHSFHYEEVRWSIGASP